MFYTSDVYADIQLIRGRFWLQLWTVKKLSEPCVLWKYLAKMWKNSKMRSQFAATLRIWADGRSLLGRLGRRCCVGHVHRVVYNDSAASVVTRGSGHTLSKKLQRTQNGTMFVDLDWPLNTLRQLSASAKLLVKWILQKSISALFLFMQSVFRMSMKHLVKCFLRRKLQLRMIYRLVVIHFHFVLIFAVYNLIFTWLWAHSKHKYMFAMYCQVWCMSSVW